MNFSKNDLLEKIDFFIFNIALGFVIWLIAITFTALKQEVTNRSRLVLTLCIGILLIYFPNKLTSKLQWMPFGKYSKVISFFVPFGVVIILLFTVGFFEISIVKL